MYNASYKFSNEVENILLDLNGSNNIIAKSVDIIKHINTGFCYSNYFMQQTFICISKTDSVAEFINTVSHEIKHLQSHICEYYGIPESGEEAAYLVGDVTMSLFLELEQFIIKEIQK